VVGSALAAAAPEKGQTPGFHLVEVREVIEQLIIPRSLCHGVRLRTRRILAPASELSNSRVEPLRHPRSDVPQPNTPARATPAHGDLFALLDRGRGRPRAAPLLLATDVAGSLAIGIDNVFLMLGELGTLRCRLRHALRTAARFAHGPAARVSASVRYRPLASRFGALLARISTTATLWGGSSNAMSRA